eukprot:TRINITY_DN5953_c0_g2_i1.p1 TRINITY_DN5953_c0_g2~~TRINITY_DN5953_c0_g2_i1.p1  ORF type:complete len:105 (+),score=2.89 TRINITY_DN5953_c0_g2_i1:26-316(+)
MKNSIVVIIACCLLYTAAVAQPNSSGEYTCAVGTAGQIVKVTQDGTNRIIKSNRCPWHDWTTQKTPNSAQARCTTYRLPLKPTINKNKVSAWWITG